MKYALLAYDDASWDSLPAAAKRALHDPDQYGAMANGPARPLAHYRLRPPRMTTTVRRHGDEVVQSEGPTTTNASLRAIFLLESDDRDDVIDFAGRLPAVHLGGSVEVWPLIEPNPHGHRGRGSHARHGDQDDSH